MRRTLALVAVLAALVTACSDAKKSAAPAPVVEASAVPGAKPAGEPAPAPEAPAAPPGPHDYRPGVLPKAFPLPLPEGAVVVGGIETPVAEGTAYHVTITTSLAPAAVVELYSKTFKEKKLTVEQTSEDTAGLTFVSLTGRSQTVTASALVTLEPGFTKVVGTPLSVVAGRARALAKKADDPEAVQKNGSIIAEQAARITRIIQRLLDFSRRRVDERGPVDVNRLAQDTLEFLEHQLAKNGILVESHPDGSLPPLPASKDQLQQVLLNLFMNAIQAMPRGGRLAYAAGRVQRRRPGLEADPEQEYAVLEIRDTGVGIPPADREKIFEPFYTSKSDDGGSGLGLAVAHGIVKDHDGWIELDDNDQDGRGTVFRVFLPLRETQAAAPAQPPPPESVAPASSA